MKKRVLFLIVVCFLYTIVLFFYVSKTVVMAEELREKAEDIIEEEENGFVSLDEEIEQDDEPVLSDTFENLSDYYSEDEEDQSNYQNGDYVSEDQEENAEVIVKSKLGATRSMVNTYTDTNAWNFIKSNYRTTYRPLVTDIDTGNQVRTYIFIFQKDKLPDFEHIKIFVNSSTKFRLFDFDDPDIYAVTYDSDVYNWLSSSVKSACVTFINEQGYPDSNCYWQAPEPTGEPSPTVTPEPTGTPNPVPESDNSFKVIVVFCFGLCAGVIVGHFLTGFIK